MGMFMFGSLVPGRAEAPSDLEQFRLQKVTVARMLAVKAALVEYQQDRRRIPATLTELVPKYLADSAYFVDGWKHGLYYAAADEQFVLLSFGRDGVAAQTNVVSAGRDGPDYDGDIVMISGEWARLPWGIGY